MSHKPKYSKVKFTYYSSADGQQIKRQLIINNSSNPVNDVENCGCKLNCACFLTVAVTCG